MTLNDSFTNKEHSLLYVAAFDISLFRSFHYGSSLFTIRLPLVFFINYDNVLSVEHKVVPLVECFAMLVIDQNQGFLISKIRL